MKLNTQELRYLEMLNTVQGQRLLAEVGKQIEQERTELSLAKQEKGELELIKYGKKWANTHGNKEQIMKIADAYHIVKSNEWGVIESIDLLKNGMELSKPLQDQLKEPMFEDGLLSHTVTKDTYAMKIDAMNKPLAYLEELTLGNQVRADQINMEFSIDGRKIATKMLSEVETKIHNLEVGLGYKDGQPLQGESV